MSTRKNKEIVRGFYEAGNSGDMDACFDFISDDIKWVNVGSTSLSGTFRGKEELMEKLLGPLFARLKAGIFTRINRLIAEGEFVVVSAGDVAAGEQRGLEALVGPGALSQIDQISTARMRDLLNVPQVDSPSGP